MTTKPDNDCPTTEIVPERGRGAGTGEKDAQLVSGGESDLNRPPAAQNEGLSVGQRFESGSTVRYHGREWMFSHYLNGQPETDLAILRRGTDRALVEVGGLEQVAGSERDDAVLADLDTVIEGLAEAGEREEAERLRQVERRAWHDAYPESRSWLADWLPKDEHEAEIMKLGRNMKRPVPRQYLTGERVMINTEAVVCDVSHSHGLSYKVILPKGDYLYPREIWLEPSECTTANTDANATLNLLRDLEQRVQVVHRCGDAEQARLLLVAIKGILNGAIAEREERA